MSSIIYCVNLNNLNLFNGSTRCASVQHAPQFAPDSFVGYSHRGLQGDSLGLIDRSAGERRV